MKPYIHVRVRGDLWALATRALFLGLANSAKSGSVRARAVSAWCQWAVSFRWPAEEIEAIEAEEAKVNA
jgi:hypothetical protein